MMIPAIIIGNHKNHNGSCNSNILLMIKNNLKLQYEIEQYPNLQFY